MTDSYHTLGAQRDRARTWAIAEEQNKRLEDVANGLVIVANALAQRDESRKSYHVGENHHLEAVLTHEGLIVDLYHGETGQPIASMGWTAVELAGAAIDLTVKRVASEEE